MLRPVPTPFLTDETPVTSEAPVTDEALVPRILAGETALFELIMRRHNQRLFRAARAILNDDAEAEDVMQETYVRAFAHLGQFRGDALLATWLTRIAVHEAFARVRRRRRLAALPPDDKRGAPRTARARDRGAARDVPHGVRAPRGGRPVDRDDCRVPRRQRGSGEDSAL